MKMTCPNLAALGFFFIKKELVDFFVTEKEESQAPPSSMETTVDSAAIPEQVRKIVYEVNTSDKC